MWAVSQKRILIRFDLTGNSKSYCCSTLIKRHKVKFGVLNTVNNTPFADHLGEKDIHVREV